MHGNHLLKRALGANAAFSGLTGLGALTLAASLADRLGPPAWSLRAIGVGLLAFGVLVAREARRPGPNGTRQVIAADLAWVISAMIVVATGPSWLTGTGRVVVASVTAIVGVVAAAQWRGLESVS